MGIIKRVKSIFNNTMRPEKWGGSWFYSVDGSYNAFNGEDNLEYFNTIPELNAVINWKAKQQANQLIMMYLNY